MPKPVDTPEATTHESTTHRSQLLDQVSVGECVGMSSQGDPVARRVPGLAQGRVFGVDAGVFSVPDDLDEPLPDDVLASFE